MVTRKKKPNSREKRSIRVRTSLRKHVHKHCDYLQPRQTLTHAGCHNENKKGGGKERKNHLAHGRHDVRIKVKSR